MCDESRRRVDCELPRGRLVVERGEETFECRTEQSGFSYTHAAPSSVTLVIHSTPCDAIAAIYFVLVPLLSPPPTTSVDKCKVSVWHNLSFVCVAEKMTLGIGEAAAVTN